MDAERFIETCSDVLASCNSFDPAIVASAASALAVLSSRDFTHAHTARGYNAVSGLQAAMKYHFNDSNLLDHASEAIGALCSSVTSNLADGVSNAVTSGSASSASGAASGPLHSFSLPLSGTLRLRQLSFTSAGVGWRPWSASKMLALLIERSPDVIANSDVLELGAGVGLPGIACALCAKPVSVTLSDRSPSIVLTLDENIKLNGLDGSHVYARMHPWEWDLDTKDGKQTQIRDLEGCVSLRDGETFDVIIGAEVAWSDAQPEPFAKAVAKRLRKPGGLGWFVCACRGTVIQQVIDSLSKQNLFVTWRWVSALPTPVITRFTLSYRSPASNCRLLVILLWQLKERVMRQMLARRWCARVSSTTQRLR